MGNLLIFGDREKYVIFEATLGGILLLGALAGGVIFFLIYYYCCKTEDDSDNRDSCDCSGDCGKNCKEFCTSLKHFHRILGIVFSSISELYVKSDDSRTVSTAKPVGILIISEREVPKECCIESWTYLYFSYMLVMCVMWFIAMTVELSIYRKTGTCNDINVEVQSFSCFDVDNNFEKIDCEHTPDIATRRVICYLYSPTIAGFGVALSAAKLISLVGDFAYNLILRGTSKCGVCTAVLRCLGLALAVPGFVVFMVLGHNRIFDTNYFTYGGIPMRYVQLLLLFFTVIGILLLSPWKTYSNEEYNTKYRHLGYKDVETGS